MTRPGPQASAFSLCGGWLDPCAEPGSLEAAYERFAGIVQQARQAAQAAVEAAELELSKSELTRAKVNQQIIAVEQRYNSLQQEGKQLQFLGRLDSQTAQKIDHECRTLIEQRGELVERSKDLSGQIEAEHARLLAASERKELLGNRLEALGPRVEWVQRLLELEKPVTTTVVPSTVAPSIVNVHQPPPPRYFRALVWNLENFTHDRRPRGSAAIDSPRNQARLAIVAHTAARLGIDALLVMETGSDVGQAMTHVARRWADKEELLDSSPRSVEPLVSPATHAIPELALEFLDRSFEATPEAVRAVRLISEGYQVRPTAFASVEFDAALAAGLALLLETSSDVQQLGLFPELGSSSDATLFNWSSWAFEGLVNQFGFEQASEDDWELVVRLMGEAASSPLQLLHDLEQDLGLVREALLAARDLAASERGAGPSAAAGVAELIELLLLALLHAGGQAGFSTTGPHLQNPVWLNDHGEPASLVLLCYLLANGAHLDLEAHDQELGPTATTSDGELLIGALMRVGLIPKAHAETYGVAYRPYSTGHLEAFFNAPFEELGFNTSGIYGVLHSDKTGTLLVSQEPSGLLGGRSALKVQFPIHPKLWIGFVVHHNRYTATADIKVMDDSYSKDMNMVRARLLTVEDEARAVSQHDPAPLIVGDFNIPSPYLEEEPTKRKTKAWKQRAALRADHVRELAEAGYLRRRRANGSHPATTLRGSRMIGRGEFFSEPYDGVYQPFDFLGGAAKVRCAAVRHLEAFFAGDIADEQITAATDSGLQAMTVGAVLAEHLAAIYKSIVGGILKRIKTCEPWLDKAVAKSKSKTFKAGYALLRSNRSKLKKELWRRAFAFEKTVTGVGALAKFDADPARLEQLARQIEETLDRKPTLTRKKGRPAAGETESKLVKVPDHLRSLAGLETDNERRLWAIYGAVVSDHLPMLVEIEFTP